MQRLSPNIDDEVIYVGLKGFSRYSDKNALSFDEIEKLCKSKRVFVALNRIAEFDEIKKVVKRLDCDGFIINDLGFIWKIKRDKELDSKTITSSVGLNPLNYLDIQFFEEIGVDVAVIPPEINDDVDDLRNKTKIKIEAFEFALMEMFYKGKCLLSAYFDGVSTKKSGVCTKRCCKKWSVIINGKTIKFKSFNPKAVRFDVNADLLKIEGRQFGIKNGRN